MATVLERWGRIDVLVNNGRYVGPGHMDQILDTPVELLDRHLEANVMAPVILTKLVLPRMVERGSGVVINLASGSGTMDPPAPAGQGGWGWATACPKAALHRLAGILAVELGDRGIRAYNLSPGFIATERIAIDMGELRVRRHRPARPPTWSARWRPGWSPPPRPRARNGEWVEAQDGLPRARAAARVALRGVRQRRRPVRLLGPPDGRADASTRDLLLDAAARLFAERGIDNVSIAEIVRAADQRNASAVHYHFGSRDEVLRALLARHVPAIAERRHASCSSRPGPGADDDVRSAAEAIVRPVTEFAQRGWRERAYLQIGSEMTGAVDRTTPEIRELLAQTDGPRRPGTCCAQRCPRCPPTSGGCGGRSASCSSAGRPPTGPGSSTAADSGTVLSDDRFVDNLVDMVIGAMTAPHLGG